MTKALCQRYGYDRESVLCLCFLGYLTLNRQRAGAVKKAADYFYPALKQAAQFRLVSAALDILVGLAILAVHSGEKRRAVELLTVALRHPGAERGTKNRAMRLLTELGIDPRPNQVAPAPERDPVPDLWAVASKKLERLKKTYSTLS